MRQIRSAVPTTIIPRQVLIAARKRIRITWSGLITEPVSFFDYTFTSSAAINAPESRERSLLR